MKKFFWLISGVAAGLVIAKQIQDNPKAQAAVDDATQRAKEFGAAIAEGFKEREAELVATAPTAKAAAKVPAKSSPKSASKPSTKKPAARAVEKTPAAKKSVAKKATAPKAAAAKKISSNK